MEKYLFNILVISTILLTIPLFLRADIKLPVLISDRMVLQTETKLNIWGWAIPGERVTVRFNNRNYRTVTDKEGKWKVILPAMPCHFKYNYER